MVDAIITKFFLVTGQEIRYKRHSTGMRSRKKKDKGIFFFKNAAEKKEMSSFSCQSNKTKPNTKLVLVSREPLLYLEFHEPK